MTGIADVLLEELVAAADPARAPAMQAYMKSAMPCLGVSAVPLRAACKRVFAGLSYAELAQEQAVPLGTMKSWIRRALIRLRECLERDA